MAFEVHVEGMEALAQHRFLTEVVIERGLYDHTRATLTWRWHESVRYGERSTATLAAQALNCMVDVTWKDNDLGESLNCFHGYVERASGSRDATFSVLVFSCISYSKRTDLVPRHRAFQATTLLDIAQQVAKTEPRIKIIKPGDLAQKIPLSLQYLETDFDYLRRMMHAWSVPMTIVDSTGEVQLGARGEEASEPFPDIDFGWAEVKFDGELHTLPQASGGSSGPSGQAQQQLGQHLGQLDRKAADYYQTPERPDIAQNTFGTRGQADVSGYYLRLQGMVFPFTPGQVVMFEGQQHLIHSARIEGHESVTTASQEFWLQPLILPLPPDRSRPHWPSRSVWGHVTANEHDPLQQGRIQVEFEWEHLDPQPSGERMWLHLLTPYGGGHAPPAPQGSDHEGRKAPAYSGFYSVPEVGERVLVEFLGDWDSEAVIMGTMRHTSQKTTLNPKHTKRWSTPEGNEVTMHSRGGQHLVRMKNQNDLVFEAQKTEGGGHHASFMSGGSEDNSIHFSVNEDDTRLEIRAGKDTVLFTQNHMLIQATRHLYIQAESITLHATGAGGVKIEAQTDDISLNAQATKVSVEAKTDIALHALTGQVGVEGVKAVNVNATGGPTRIDGGPNVLLNVEGIAPVPPLAKPVPPDITPSK